MLASWDGIRIMKNNGEEEGIYKRCNYDVCKIGKTTLFLDDRFKSQMCFV